MKARQRSAGKAGGMKMHRCIPNQAILIVTLAVLLAGVHRGLAQQNTVSFENQSGEPALVKIVGPTQLHVSVPIGRKETVVVGAGRYHIKVRYGVEGRYKYSRGDDFAVTETVTKRSEVTISLRKVIGGNYRSTTISADEFGDNPDAAVASPKLLKLAAAPSVRQVLSHRTEDRADGKSRVSASYLKPVYLPGGPISALCLPSSYRVQSWGTIGTEWAFCYKTGRGRNSSRARRWTGLRVRSMRQDGGTTCRFPPTASSEPILFLAPRVQPFTPAPVSNPKWFTEQLGLSGRSMSRRMAPRCSSQKPPRLRPGNTHSTSC